MPSAIQEQFVEFPFADYLLVFISIIVGYVVTEFFAGWGGLIRNRKQVDIYWLHLGWTFCFFIQLIENWWWLWGNRLKLTEHVGFFFFSLTSPLIFYLISVFLFPAITADEKLDFKKYYYKNHFWLFTLFGCLMLAYFINNVWVKGESVTDQENLFCFVGFGFAVLSAMIKSPKFHSISFIAGSAVFLSYVIIYRTLG